MHEEVQKLTDFGKCDPLMSQAASFVERWRQVSYGLLLVAAALP